MSDDAHRTVSEIARKVRTAMFTTTTPDGSLHSRPMATQEADFDGSAWFFVARDSELVAEIARNPQVNVGYAGSGSWLSLSGPAELVDDPARKRELWNEFTAAWFPDGPDDPGVALVRVDGESAEYWETPGGKPRALLAMARARLTGSTPDPGHNETLDL
jgi:general stress protein 26